MLVLALALAIAARDTTSPAAIRREYTRIFRIEIDSGKFGWNVSADADTLPTSDPLSGFVNPHSQYLTYIAGRPLENIGPVRLAEPTVRDSLRAAYYRVMADRPEYDRAVLVPLARTLRRRGVNIIGLADSANDIVGATRAATVAARFFDPDVVLPDGRLGVHICVVRNGVLGTTGQRDMVLEGLAFEAVWNDLDRPDSTSFTAAPFARARKGVRALPVMTNQKSRIAAAEKLMWRELESSEGMRRLMVAASANSPELPIRIVSAPGGAARRRAEPR